MPSLRIRIKTLFDNQGTDEAKRGFDDVKASAAAAARELVDSAQSANRNQREFRQLAKDLGITQRQLREIMRESGRTAQELREMGVAAESAGRDAKGGLSPLPGTLGDIKTAAAAAALAIGALVRKMFDFVGEGATFAQDLSLISRGLGLTAGRTRELERALNRTGQDISDLRGIVSGLNSAVGEAIRGNETYTEAFRLLGIEATTLAGLGTEDLLDRIASAIINLGNITPEDFAAVSSILGDDDATRIIAAAADIKDGLVAELQVSDQDLEDALNLGRIRSNVENAVQDQQLGAAADLGGESVAKSWGAGLARGLGSAVDAFRDTFGAAGPIETALKGAFGEEGNLTGVTREYITRTASQFNDLADNQLSSKPDGVFGRIRKSYGVVLGAMEEDQKEWVTAMVALQSGLEQQFRDSFQNIRLAALLEYRQALAGLRAESIVTTQTGNPAEVRSTGGAEIVDQGTIIDILRAQGYDDLIEDILNPPSVAPNPEESQDNDSIWGQGGAL